MGRQRGSAGRFTKQQWKWALVPVVLVAMVALVVGVITSSFQAGYLTFLALSVVFRLAIRVFRNRGQAGEIPMRDLSRKAAPAPRAVPNPVAVTGDPVVEPPAIG